MSKKRTIVHETDQNNTINDTIVHETDQNNTINDTIVHKTGQNNTIVHKKESHYQDLLRRREELKLKIEETFSMKKDQEQAKK